MACTCELIQTGTIRGVKVCKECVHTGKALSAPLRLLMVEHLKENIRNLGPAMQTQIQRYNAIFKKEDVN